MAVDVPRRALPRSKEPENCFPGPHSMGGFPGGLVVKKLPANARDVRDTGLIRGSGRFPGGGHGNPLQYSCLENHMDRRAWLGLAHKESDTTEVT